MTSQCKVGCDQGYSDSAKRESERRDWFWNRHSREVYWSQGWNGWIHKEKKKLNRAGIPDSNASRKKSGTVSDDVTFRGTNKSCWVVAESCSEQGGAGLGAGRGGRGQVLQGLVCKLRSMYFILQTSRGCMCAGRGVYMLFFFTCIHVCKCIQDASWMNVSKTEICSVHNTSAEMHTSIS